MDGRIRAGEALPASREFAARLSVSRTTVIVAYDRLIGEGFATARVGSGTYVSHDLKPSRQPRHLRGPALHARRI
jgi:GntR family transcriptional regulator/MocR family aminotransferase